MRTLRKLLERYFNFVGNKKESFKEVIFLQQLINSVIFLQQLINSAINQNIYKSIDFNNCDNFRIFKIKVYLIKVNINSVMIFLKLKAKVIKYLLMMEYTNQMNYWK